MNGLNGMAIYLQCSFLVRSASVVVIVAEPVTHAHTRDEAHTHRQTRDKHNTQIIHGRTHSSIVSNRDTN